MIGKLAVVVGATGAFGEAIVADLAAEGLTIVGVGRKADALQEMANRFGSSFRPCVADIGCDTSISAIAQCIDGPVAAVVHSVGLPVAGGVADADIPAIATACDLKCGGFLRLIRAALPYLQRGSRLIAIGGHYGFEPSPYAMAPGAANAALANIVKQVSQAYGEQGFTAHLIAPGPAETERLRRIAADRAQRNSMSLEDELEIMKSESDIGAFTSPAQVAWMIRMLLAPEADALAGSALSLDSGRRKGIS